MNAYLYDLLGSRVRNLLCCKRVISAAAFLCLVLGGFSATQAVVTPFPSSLGQYAVLSNGSFGANGIKVYDGNVGVQSLSGANGGVINGNVDYTSYVHSSVKINGTESQSFTLGTTMSDAINFSTSLRTTAYTQLITNSNLPIPTIVGNGSENIINIKADVHSQKITLSGGANDIFYINVFNTLDLTGVILNGVAEDHVLWNIMGGNANLSGNLTGTFLAVSNGQAAQLSVTGGSTTVKGALIGGSMNLSSTTINGVSFSAAAATTMAPEASSMAAMGAFGCFLLLSSSKKFLKGKFGKIVTA